MSAGTPLHESSSADYKPQDPTDRLGFSDVFVPAAKPKNALEIYRILSPTAGVRISPIALGGMSLGNQWTGFMGGKGLDQAGSEKLLDAFFNAGGNFVDTAGSYQDEQSEHIIGEWMEKRGIRDDVVVATQVTGKTKYTNFSQERAGAKYPGIRINHAGNHAKNIRTSIEGALKRLRTTYIDLFYLHWWDYSTCIPEIMQALNDLVRSGKVLYLGVSDTPAWIVSQANEYARQLGMAQFVIYQGHWNLAARDMERDIIPMCRNNGMAIAPYGVLGSGKFYPPEVLAKRDAIRGGSPPSDKEVKVAKALQEVAKEIGGGAQLAHVALAWCRQMMPDCWPVLGTSSVEQLEANIKALGIVLTPEQMEKLDAASAFDPGFPTKIFGPDPRTVPDRIANSGLMLQAGTLKYNGYPE